MLEATKFHISLFFCLTFCLYSFAQAQFSLYTGPVFKQAAIDHERTYVNYQAEMRDKTLFCIGLDSEFPINDRLSWKTGLRYLRKDYDINIVRSYPNEFLFSIKTRFLIHAWEVPLSLSYKLDKRILNRETKLHAGFALCYQRPRYDGFSGHFYFSDSGTALYSVSGDFRVKNPVTGAAEVGITFSPLLLRRVEARLMYHLDFLPVAGIATYESDFQVDTPNIYIFEKASGTITPRRTSYVMLSLGYRINGAGSTNKKTPRFPEND